MTVIRYPYQDTITKADAIQLVYDHLYSNKDHSMAKKVIRQRIRQAQIDGHLKTPLTKSSFSAIQFFSWAVTSKGWQSINKISGLPLPAEAFVSGVSAQAVVGYVTVICMPNDRAELEEKCIELQIKEEEQNRYILKLETEIKLLKKQKDMVDKKRLALSNAMSINGKKGGKGKSYK